MTNNEILIREAIRAIDYYNFEEARLFFALLDTVKGEQLYTCQKVIEVCSNDELLEIANKWFKCAM